LETRRKGDELEPPCSLSQKIEKRDRDEKMKKRFVVEDA